MKRILVVCGMGVATSTVANKTISDYLEGRGIKANITQAKIQELSAYGSNVDCIVLMANGAEVPAEIKTPVVKGLPFLTGIGKEEALEAIATALAN